VKELLLKNLNPTTGYKASLHNVSLHF